MILGLAPAAHGANRTGRVFTGDKSADFLFQSLYETSLSSIPSSENKNDGLVLNAYMTVAEMCPPEINISFRKGSEIYLNNELVILDSPKSNCESRKNCI